MDPTSRWRGYRALLDRAQGDAAAMATLARLMHGDGLTAEAAELASRAVALAPSDAHVRVLAAETLSAEVPRWHFHMVKDSCRNGAYEAALRRAVTPDSRVLEIGCGSGILAMMAARAGARHVYTCEVVPAIAQAAREIVARNGFADRVTVLTGHSSVLSPDVVGGPVDVLVSEIVDNSLLGEDVLPTMTDAVGRLARPGAAVIPAAGSVQVALAYDDSFEGRHRLGTVDGFDLSPFNRLAKPFVRIAIDSPHLSLRSDPATLLRFDFTSGGPWARGYSSVDLTARGAANGVIQWIALELDGADRYENRPGSLPMSAWATLFHPLDPGEAARGHAAWRVHARHEAASLRLWVEPLGSGRGPVHDLEAGR